MQGRDLFGVLVRAGGLVLILRGLTDATQLIGKLIDLDMGGSRYSASAYVLGMAVFFISGLILLLCADRIVAVAYRKQPGADVGNTVRNG